jgi:hypothetical protein
MADKSPGRGWRQQGQPAPAAATTSPGAGKRGWQKQSIPTAAPRKPWSRGSKLAFAAALLGLVIGGVYAVIILLSPMPPACIVLLGSSYYDNLTLPPNLYGWKGLLDVKALTEDRADGKTIFAASGRPRLAYGPEELKGARAWENEWPKFIGKLDEATAILFLGLHGGADRKEAYFFVNDERGQEKISLPRLLDQLAREASKKKIVLVLEPAQATANWPTGLLQNDFVKRLKELEKRIEDHPNLVILCASDEGQNSWTSEEWRQTVFGHYLVEGLQGAADLDGNGRVTAHELFEYARGKVQAWAQSNRGVDQKPILLGGTARAQSIDLSQVNGTYKERTADEAPGRIFAFPAELERAWQACQNLHQFVPHPAVYSPQLWRRYQETLLRYEHLVRFGEFRDKAEELLGELGKLEKTLRNQARFDQASATLSQALPMPEVLGMPPSFGETEIDETLKLIWNAPGDEKRQDAVNQLIVWAKKQEDADPNLFNRHLLRVQVYRRLVNFLIENPLVGDEALLGKPGEQGPTRAQNLMELVETKLGPPRPAEVHFLTMLLHDASRQTPPPGDLVRQAVRLRLLAEKTALCVPDRERGKPAQHPYAEIILPWIKDKLQRADALRRPGEDWLFGTDKLAWEQACKLLQQAEDAYRVIRSETATYREALAVRDEMLAEFPYLAEWVGGQRYSTAKEREKMVTALVAQMQVMSEHLRELKLALDRDPPVLVELARATDQVKKDTKGLRLAMSGEATENAAEIHQQRIWHFREALLSVPILVDAENGEDPVAVRRKLIEVNRRTSAKLHNEPAGKVVGADISLEAAQENARRQKLMSLAAYKLYWEKELAAEENETPLHVGDTLFTIQQDWAPLLTRTLRESLAEPDLKKATARLRDADYLVRGLPAGFTPLLANDPVPVAEAARRIRFHDLLLGQAKRTDLDHWYMEPGGVDRTYYEPAARGYLKVAQTLVEDGVEGEELKKLRRAAVLNLRESIKEVGLTQDQNTATYWTSEKYFPVTWTLKTPPEAYLVEPNRLLDDRGPPPAVAMVWRDAVAPAVWEDMPAPGQRESVELRTRERSEFRRSYRLTKTGDDAQTVKAVFKSLLRGQRMTSRTDITPQPPDIVVHRFPPPPVGAVSVRMDRRFTYGAITIVLDISGSMIWKGYAIGEGEKKRLRIDCALEALETTLNQIPENTYVSLLAFVTKRKGKAEDEYPETKVIVPPDSWRRDPERTKRIIADTRELAYGGSDRTGPSPIAKTVVEAYYEKGFPKAAVGFRGPKLLLALTDGDDNYTGEILNKKDWPKADANPVGYARKISEYLTEELGGRDVEIHFVCFNNKNDEESKRAEQQWANFVENSLRVKGRFVVQPDPEKLADELEKAMRPHLQVTQGDVTPRWNYGPAGLPASMPDKLERQWEELPPGQYSIKVPRSESREMKIDPGEMIAITLKRDPSDGKKVVYEREIFAEVMADRTQLLVEPKKQEYRLAALLENHLDVKNNQLSQLVSLEGTYQAGTLQQSVPRFVWLETKAKDAVPRLMRWYREYGYPAPTYRLRADDWPATQGRASRSRVHVWWTETPEDSNFSQQFERAIKKKAPDPVRLGDVAIEVEDASIEDKLIAPNDRGRIGEPDTLVSKPCLVVRLKHPPDQPVFVQLQAKHRGEEHHYFSGANKYTAIFWDLEEPDKQSFGYNVIFLDALKKAAPNVEFPEIRGTNQLTSPRWQFRD